MSNRDYDQSSLHRRDCVVIFYAVSDEIPLTGSAESLVTSVKGMDEGWGNPVILSRKGHVCVPAPGKHLEIVEQRGKPGCYPDLAAGDRGIPDILRSRDAFLAIPVGP